MQRLLKSLGLFLVLFAIVNLANAQKTSPPQQVVVTNPSTSPVPVSGVVNLGNVNNPIPVVASGGAALPVAVQNTPSVNINSMPAVALGSGATVTVDPSTTVNTADAAARNIVRLYAYSSTGDNSNAIVLATYDGTPYRVPTGTRLVINNFTFSFSLPTGTFRVPTILIGAVVADHAAYYEFQFEPHKMTTDNNLDSYLVTSAAPLYVDEAEFTYITLNLGYGTTYSVYGVFQGYLVKCGSGGCTQQ